MRSVIVRGFLTRKLRSALTAIAILLGVAMISGTFVLTDKINTAFTDIFEEGNANVDVVVKQESLFTSDDEHVRLRAVRRRRSPTASPACPASPRSRPASRRRASWCAATRSSSRPPTAPRRCLHGHAARPQRLHADRGHACRRPPARSRSSRTRRTTTTSPSATSCRSRPTRACTPSPSRASSSSATSRRSAAPR